MLVEYAATEIGFLDDYSYADPNHKSIRGMVSLYSSFMLPNVLFSVQQIVLKQYLLPMHHWSHFNQG